jgi:hypothetical protein
MSAIFGALALFYALALVATTVALAADSRPSLGSRSQRAAYYPADAMTDDERVLTTHAAPVAAAMPEVVFELDRDSERAA